MFRFFRAHLAAGPLFPSRKEHTRQVKTGIWCIMESELIFDNGYNQKEDNMEKETLLEVPGQAKAYAPYSYGCIVKKVDTFIFISGVVPNDSNGDIVCKGDILGQTRKTVENLRATVEAAGGSFNDVIKLTTYVVADAMKDYLSTSACFEYLSSFPKPSESLVGVACLANDGQLIEIEGIFGR